MILFFLVATTIVAATILVGFFLFEKELSNQECNCDYQRSEGYNFLNHNCLF